MRCITVMRKKKYAAIGAEIAFATSKQMEEFEAVVWSHHGLFCFGPDLRKTSGSSSTAVFAYLHQTRSEQEYYFTESALQM